MCWGILLSAVWENHSQDDLPFYQFSASCSIAKGPDSKQHVRIVYVDQVVPDARVFPQPGLQSCSPEKDGSRLDSASWCGLHWTSPSCCNVFASGHFLNGATLLKCPNTTDLWSSPDMPAPCLIKCGWECNVLHHDGYTLSTGLPMFLVGEAELLSECYVTFVCEF